MIAMAVTAERERTFAFSMRNAVVSTIGVPEDPVVVDTAVGKKTIRNLNPGAVLLSVKAGEQKLTLAIYFKGSLDKEGYGQLVPFFHDTETLRLFNADIFLAYPGNSRKIIGDSRTAISMISSTKDFDFENAEYEFGSGSASINLHSHSGIKTASDAVALRVMIVLKMACELPAEVRRP
jgi:hypothetical protein